MLTTLFAATILTALPSWEFNDPDAVRQWVPNSHLTDARVSNGCLSATAIDWDPFFNCDAQEIPATPWQYVVLRMKADEPGMGELYWSGETTGQYGGLSPQKRTPFQVTGGNEWQEIVLFPFWQGEGVIRKMRLDVYQGAKFSIDFIRLEAWADETTASSRKTAWSFGEGATAWQRHAAADEYLSPPLKLDVSSWPWIALQLTSPNEGVGTISWAGRQSHDRQTYEFLVEPNKKSQCYNLGMQEVADWKGEIAVLGVRLPPSAQLHAVTLSAQPVGPARLKPVSLGFATGVNRVGQSAKLQLHVQNVGGAEALPIPVRLELPASMQVLDQPAPRTVAPVKFGEKTLVEWSVTGDTPGSFEAKAVADPHFAITERLYIDPKVEQGKASYVPPPSPVQTDVEVCAYYFPGFKPDAKWSPIRDTAPIRKPLLGWYDEGNPECVDWQIKWARENAISVFFVDWYWVAGKQQLTHWFEAYRQARYRDQLKVAIMWANHNPPNTHSMDDWDRVTREWLERYFTLPGYYRIASKPLIMIWDPRRLREDLAHEFSQNNRGQTADSTKLVREALQHSRRLAREAGHGGITFAAILHAPSATHCQTLAAEGYDLVTSYHEWGHAPELGSSPQRMRFDDVVATAPQRWREWKSDAGELDYYPLIDTGWDSRPWHGAKARVISGRTPGKFEALLRAAKDYTQATGTPRVVLGPLNEWGEGSYIEPCAEFGFQMMEKVRDVFGTGPSDMWPVNIGPADVGLGPYEYARSGESR